PSPEDVTAAIADADNKAALAQTAYSNLTSQLRGMAYKDINALGSQGITIIDGGNFLTFNADISYLRANVANIEYLNGLEFDFTQGTVDRLKTRVINAEEIVVSGGGRKNLIWPDKWKSLNYGAAISEYADFATGVNGGTERNSIQYFPNPFGTND